MRTPSTDKASNELVRIGLYHLTGLERVEETAALAGAFRERNEELARAWEARVAAEQDLAPKLAIVHHIDVEMDGQLLAFGDAVKAHDKEAGSAVFPALFPNGLERVIQPIGSLETTAVRQILARLGEQGDAGELGGWAEPLNSTLTEYETAISERVDAEQTLRRAREAEDDARQAWFDAIAVHGETIDEQFPDSEATRALFFPPGS